MTILTEIAALYDRRAEAKGWPRPGFSTEKIGAEVVLTDDGRVVAIRSMMAPDLKGKMQPRMMSVPAAVTRTAGVKSNLLWDKTSYTLGVTAVETDGAITAGQAARTLEEHAAFKVAQLDLIGDSDDPGLSALAAFCRTWDPAQFLDFPDALALLDQNTIFTLQDGTALHALPAALAGLKASSAAAPVMCLVTGQDGPPARLHPKIKGVMGAQSSGASLVSFNIDAAESNAKEQGDNAPTSEEAAFAYGTALNAMLARDSGHSLRHGDATMVFWATARDPQAELEAEDALGLAFALSQPKGRDDDAESLLRQNLVAIARGQVPSGSALDPASRIFLLGLSPNAARLSVRFWHTDRLDALAQRVTRFWDECAITPSPFMRRGLLRMPRPVALLYDLAAQHDGKNIPPNLAGDLMRAVLTGQPYPATLLPTVIGRIRVEGDPDHAKHGNVDGRRSALIRAFLTRNLKQEVPMALTESETDVAYLLGRLFGAYVYAERSYQDRGASLRSKYMGAASATPARVFPVLMRGYEHNLASLRKAGGQKAGSGIKADRAVSAIMSNLPGGKLPSALPLEAQGRFFVGFYHQLSAFYAKAEDAVDDLIDTQDTGEDA
ncbi:type I-C CRISPR-associated protein Cas8c/Csd1 [Pararhodobacter oceanensis]|uniref:type I-C CRISPR-associated protein Cas8c/Csd1 n=1 Tax=Pararhodobacter oceanensis TaxID=2172121 RepID=UPI003A9340AB